jgi:hypothetical protein
MATYVDEELKFSPFRCDVPYSGKVPFDFWRDGAFLSVVCILIFRPVILPS